MAGANVVYDEGVFSWTYVPGNVPATELRLKWGTSDTALTNQKVYPASNGTAKIDTVLPTGSVGQFYAKLVAANAKGEGVASALVPFVVSDGLPNGSITFTVG